MLSSHDNNIEFIKTKNAILTVFAQYHKKLINLTLFTEFYNHIASTTNYEDLFKSFIIMEKNLIKVLNNDYIIQLNKEQPFIEQIDEISPIAKDAIQFIAMINLAFIQNIKLKNLVKLNNTSYMEKISHLLHVDKFVASPKKTSKDEVMISQKNERHFLYLIKKIILFSLSKIEFYDGGEFISILANELNNIFINGKYTAKARSIEVNPTSDLAYAKSIEIINNSLDITTRIASNVFNVGTTSCLTIPVWPQVDTDYLSIVEGSHVYFDNPNKIQQSLTNHLCGSISFSDEGQPFLSPFHIDIYHECLHARNNAIGINLVNSQNINNHEKLVWSNLEEFAVIAYMHGCQNKINQLYNLPNAFGHAGIPAITLLIPENDEFFLSESVKFYSRNRNEELGLAIINNNLNKVIDLLNEGVNINAIDNESNNAILLAIYHNKIDIFKFLLNSGASYNHINNNGYNSIALAVELRNENIVEILARYDNIIINHNNRVNGNPPLTNAIIRNDINIAHMLLMHHDINVEKINDDNKNPLQVAIELNRIEIMELVITTSNLNVKKLDYDFYGNPTLLHYAVHHSRLEIIKLFHTHHFSIKNVIYYCILENNPILAVELYNLGIRLDKKDIESSTQKPKRRYYASSNSYTFFLSKPHSSLLENYLEIYDQTNKIRLQISLEICNLKNNFYQNNMGLLIKRKNHSRANLSEVHNSIDQIKENISLHHQFKNKLVEYLFQYMALTHDEKTRYWSYFVLWNDAQKIIKALDFIILKLDPLNKNLFFQSDLFQSLHSEAGRNLLIELFDLLIYHNKNVYLLEGDKIQVEYIVDPKCSELLTAKYDIDLLKEDLSIDNFNHLLDISRQKGNPEVIESMTLKYPKTWSVAFANTMDTEGQHNYYLLDSSITLLHEINHMIALLSGDFVISRHCNILPRNLKYYQELEEYLNIEKRQYAESKIDPIGFRRIGHLGFEFSSIKQLTFDVICDTLLNESILELNQKRIDLYREAKNTSLYNKKYPN